MSEPSVNVGQELVSRLKALNDRLEAEAARLRLTDAERDLLEWLAAGVDDRQNTHQTLTPAARATIRGLLERLGGGR